MSHRFIALDVWSGQHTAPQPRHIAVAHIQAVYTAPANGHTIVSLTGGTDLLVSNSPADILAMIGEKDGDGIDMQLAPEWGQPADDRVRLAVT